MKYLLKFDAPSESSNTPLRDPEFGKKMEKFLSDIKAEAAYFTAVNGHRGGYILVNMDDASQMPALAEPLFFWLHANIELIPVMLPEDLAKAGPAIGEAIQNWG